MKPHYLPVKSYFGKGVISDMKQVFTHYGTKALLVTGKASAIASGAQADVLEALETLSIDYVIFNGIEENPSVETVKQAATFGLEQGADFIIGIGGGSPLDACKAIAMIMRQPHLLKGNLFGLKPMKALPIIAIPTTSGTGSEVTPYAILTDHVDQTKKNLGQSIYPKVALLDPKYTESLSEQVTIHTAVDAFTHLAEGFLNTNATLLSDALAKEGLRLFSKQIPKLLTQEFDSVFRKEMMEVSMLAGMVIAQTGTSLPHGMGYALTYHHGLPHGLANGVLFSAYLEVFNDDTLVKDLLRAMELPNLESLTEALRTLCRVDLTLDEATLWRYAEEMGQNQAKLKNHPEKITTETLLKMYLKSLSI